MEEIENARINPDFKEWQILNELSQDLPALAEISTLGYSANLKNEKLPIQAVCFGTKEKTAPTLALFGGVHGLERIGSQVVLSLLSSFRQLLLWDPIAQNLLNEMRIVFLPIINPWGIKNRTRSNPQGVDLMRNAPIDADAPTFLVGGHRYSKHLPWHRGDKIQSETKAIIDFFERELLQAKVLFSMDVHSGFGVRDQLWFPYAKTKKPFPHLPEMNAWTNLFESTHPHHFYSIEPQAKNYTTHGDLWDYVYEAYRAANPTGVYLPLTLEMGSWLWVRKNPLQIFSSLGAFHPVKPHREKRILRRHQTLFDFAIRSTHSSGVWAKLSAEQKNKHLTQATHKWY